MTWKEYCNLDRELDPAKDFAGFMVSMASIFVCWPLIVGSVLCVAATHGFRAIIHNALSRRSWERTCQ